MLRTPQNCILARRSSRGLAGRMLALALYNKSVVSTMSVISFVKWVVSDPWVPKRSFETLGRAMTRPKMSTIPCFKPNSISLDSLWKIVRNVFNLILVKDRHYVHVETVCPCGINPRMFWLRTVCAMYNVRSQKPLRVLYEPSLLFILVKSYVIRRRGGFSALY